MGRSKPCYLAAEKSDQGQDAAREGKHDSGAGGADRAESAACIASRRMERYNRDGHEGSEPSDVAVQVGEKWDGEARIGRGSACACTSLYMRCKVARCPICPLYDFVRVRRMDQTRMTVPRTSMAFCCLRVRNRSSMGERGLTMGPMALRSTPRILDPGGMTRVEEERVIWSMT